MGQIAPGRIVLLKLSDTQAEAINRRRRNAADHMEQHQANANGVMIHIGNFVKMGDVFPMIITRVWGTGVGAVNGMLFLDGNDPFWVTSALEGDGPGDYVWPTIA